MEFHAGDVVQVEIDRITERNVFVKFVDDAGSAQNVPEQEEGV